MTDMERFKALCKDFGLAPEETVRTGEPFDAPKGEVRILFQKPQPKVEGYASAMGSYDFNPDGSFKCVGVWE